MNKFEELLEMVDKMPCGTLHIDKNRNRSYYENIREYLVDRELELSEKIISECEAANTVWEVQVYPDSGRSFYNSINSTLETCCEELIEALKNHEVSSFNIKFENGRMIRE